MAGVGFESLPEEDGDAEATDSPAADDTPGADDAPIAEEAAVTDDTADTVDQEDEEDDGEGSGETGFVDMTYDPVEGKAALAAASVGTPEEEPVEAGAEA